MSFSVVIPAFNEEGAVGKTVSSVNAILQSEGMSGFEVLVVDDGSLDRTGAEAAEAGATVVRNCHNLGYGASLKRGIQAARHDTIVIIDADLTYPVSVIPELVARHREGFDMVVAERTGKHYRESYIKMPLRRVLRFLVEYTAGRKIPDINSGLRVFSKATITPFFPHLCNTFSFTTSATLSYMMTGKFVSYLPIDYDERAGKTKVKLVRDAMRTMQYIIETSIYYNPLKFFMLMSFAMLLLSGVSFVMAEAIGMLIFYILGVGALLSAPLIFSLGLLAVLLKQIMAK